MDHLYQVPEVKAHLQKERPAVLFHYTGPAGFIGICQSRQLWAARADDLNDRTEHKLAFKLAQEVAQGFLSGTDRERPAPTEAWATAVTRIAGDFGAANDFSFADTNLYTVSLTTQMDSLEQWRAYCPRSGGVALGLPTVHLERVAAEQQFYLGSCVYDDGEQRRLIASILTYFIDKWKREAIAPSEDAVDAHLREFKQYVIQFAPLLKHEAFSTEDEWRLISERGVVHYGRQVHIPTATGLRMYLPLELVTPDHPTVEVRLDEVAGMTNADMGRSVGFVIGPNVDQSAMTDAVNVLAWRQFGSFWVMESGIPLR